MKYILTLLLVPFVAISYGIYGNILSLEQAEKKWGQKPFNKKIFREGDDKQRAFMVVDLIKSKRYVGKDFKVLYDELGSGKGYYISDLIPAYILERGKNDQDLSLIHISEPTRPY